MANIFPLSTFTTPELASMRERGFTAVVPNGVCDVVSNSDPTDIWAPGGIRPWLQAPEQLQAISDDPRDTLLGDGAQGVLLAGLDVLGMPYLTVLDMAGTSFLL